MDGVSLGSRLLKLSAYDVDEGVPISSPLVDPLYELVVLMLLGLSMSASPFSTDPLLEMSASDINTQNLFHKRIKSVPPYVSMTKQTDERMNRVCKIDLFCARRSIYYI